MLLAVVCEGGVITQYLDGVKVRKLPHSVVELPTLNGGDFSAFGYKVPRGFVPPGDWTLEARQTFAGVAEIRVTAAVRDVVRGQ